MVEIRGGDKEKIKKTDIGRKSSPESDIARERKEEKNGLSLKEKEKNLKSISSHNAGGVLHTWDEGCG